jgi:hypothetical protein
MRARPFWWALLLACLAAGCGSTSVSVTAPTGSKCQVSASSSLPSAPATGAAGTINVNTNRDCTWSASSAAAWIAITSGASGQGEGAVNFTVSENPDPAPRRGMVTVNDAQIAIAQDPASCHFTVTPASAGMQAAGGSTTLHVDTRAGCAWTATSQANWIQVTAGSQGNGPGTFTIVVSANTGVARTANVQAAGQTITVAQSAVACDAVLTPTTTNVAAQGGTQSFAVAIAGPCQWTAASAVDWIAVVAASSGTGPGQVQFSVSPNPTATARQGVLTLAGQTFTVMQAGAPCTFALSSSARSVDAAAGTGAVSLTSVSGCAWTAASNAPWLAVTGGGSGSGTVTYSFTANAGPARSGTITIGGQAFTITQASGCTPSLSATSQALGSSGGTGSVNVTAAGGCGWTAASANPDWLTITGATSGTGNGTVTFTAAGNPGAARSGTLTIAGQNFTVTESAPCAFSIAPQSQNFEMSGGGGSVAVTTAGGCAWSAASNNPDWIGITSAPSGNGPGSIGFSVGANGGPARSGTITVAGQPFTVTQAAFVCTYTIAPPGQVADAIGGNGAMTLTTPGSCTWTAASTVDWIVLTSAPSGTGSTTITFFISANPGAPRNGTVTVAGQVFTVTQSGM